MNRTVVSERGLLLLAVTGIALVLQTPWMLNVILGFHAIIWTMMLISISEDLRDLRNAQASADDDVSQGGPT